VTWSFEDAHNRLDELLDCVELQGSQHVMRGDTRFIVKLEPATIQEENQLVRAILDGPEWTENDIERIKGKMRDVNIY